MPIASDKSAIEESLSKDTWVSQFAKEGNELLEKTNRPNVITVEQFMPFIELFNMNKERYGSDKQYTDYIHELNKQFLHSLGINLYEVTYVINSKEDQTIVCFLNRRFTRINGDHIEGASNRDYVPPVVAKASGTTRDTLLIEASIKDLVEANRTPEQMKFFSRVKMESAVIQKNFTQLNQTPDKRPDVAKAVAIETPGDDESFGAVILDDD